MDKKMREYSKSSLSPWKASQGKEKKVRDGKSLNPVTWAGRGGGRDLVQHKGN